MKKFLSVILLLYIILFQISIVFANPVNDDEQAVTQTEKAYKDEEGNIILPKLLCKGAVLLNADTGEVLFEKNMHEKLFPASTTKVMTAILALEKGKLDDIIHFTAENVNSFDYMSSSIGMRAGETLTLEHALNGLMIASANEVAKGIAENLCATEAEFAAEMTKRAKELGALNTNFVNAHGLHDDNHYTTAYDLAIIFKHALEYPYFKKLISTLSYEIPPTNIVSESRPLGAKNRIILKNSGYYYEGCGGGKTGFTDQAGNTLVTYATKNGLNLIAVVMLDPPLGTYTDTIALYDYGFTFFKKEMIFDKYTFKKDIPVIQKNGEEVIQRGSVVVVAKDNINKTIREDEIGANFGIKEDLPTELIAPINEDDIVGKLEVYLNAEKYGETDLIAFTSVSALEDTEIKEMKKEAFVEDVKIKLPIYLTFVPVIILLVSLIISVIIKYIKHRRNKKRFGGKVKYRIK